MTSQVEPFQAIGISRLAHELQSEGRSIIHMEFGQPSTGAPRAAIETAHHFLDTSALGYWESPALKARIAHQYDETYRTLVNSEQIVLTCGASPALLLALITMFEPGDRVALARPGYVAYRNTLRALHMVPVELECGAERRYQLTAAAIEALDPPPVGVIIASPANPTGTIITATELEAIVKVCRERHIRIVSDEIYHGLSYIEPAHSIIEFEPDALIINSFSKYYSMTGWRLGWLLAPLQHVERARSYAGNLFLSAPSLSQHAALAAMDSREELEANVEVYRHNRVLLLKALPSLGLDAIAPPDGAFYIYANVRHLTDDSMRFCIALLRETGVAVAPGVDFDPVDGRHFIRMSFAASTSDVEEAIQRLVPWFASRGRAASLHATREPGLER
ncbi:aminotransferase class I/II-fold pyridoxal phosphate-dependent enzyme [Rhodanobacter glycinis]|uniref:Aminotransferase n=1 Tax=Rhodanobacter glycinis TaxID=582702 RepID=A0A5B9DY38_9GAMM|nr:aminotransferase class I/II-fold pyridoxal phosphate-dependent enzyme [Rhodanobacter glycinis]QEE24943.1 aminotransferase class I/II-fold pyridoxal phosphate-dependent enzyme [Rhodanobacter glycinis]